MITINSPALQHITGNAHAEQIQSKEDNRKVEECQARKLAADLLDGKTSF
jgi:hypothetical protein